MSIKPKQKIIVVTGVESTGKTTLAKQLAEELEAAYVPEYARTYLEKRNGKYGYEDLEEIAKLQLLAIKNTSSPIVIVDTALLVLKIWSEEKYGKCSRFILNELARFTPAAYLLCDIDIPWQEDALREHPKEEDRIRLHKTYLAHLQEEGSRFGILKASDPAHRLSEAIAFINKA